MDKQRGDLYESVFYDASDLLEDAIQELAQTYGVDHQTVVNFILVLTTFVETIRRSNLHLLQASRHDTQLALARWPRCGSVEDSFEGVYHDEAEDEAEDDEEHGGHDEDDEEEEEEEISDDWGDNETLSDDSDEPDDGRTGVATRATSPSLYQPLTTPWRDVERRVGILMIDPDFWHHCYRHNATAHFHDGFVSPRDLEGPRMPSADPWHTIDHYKYPLVCPLVNESRALRACWEKISEDPDASWY